MALDLWIGFVIKYFMTAYDAGLRRNYFFPGIYSANIVLDILLHTLPCHLKRIQEFSSGGGGGGGRGSRSLLQKSSDNVFIFLFLVLSLFYRSQMVNFKEIYGSRGGPTFSRGGPTFSKGGGGSQLLIPYGNPYNL